jgi:parallel beta-helix repeat protein
VGEELIPANGTRVENNTIVDGLAQGILVADSADVQILYNVVRDAGGPGLIMELGRNAVIRGNDFSGNAGGIIVEESSDTLVESNNASGSLGSGIEVAEMSGGGNVVANNAANANGGEGIAIEGSAPTGLGTEVIGNTADGNGGDGISVEGVGHLIGGPQKADGNTVQLNGGWGIYAIGAIDKGNNFAAGNMEPGQCFGVVCTIGAPPGAPETFIVEKPPAISNSRNASFTYFGRDDVTPLIDLVYECRLDTTDDLAWEDCEYPAQYVNLAPGLHTFEVRAIDMRGSGLADASPAKYTWRYEPLPPNDAPETTIDIKPPAETWLPEAIFTYHANEPDVIFECRLDNLIWEICSFEELVNPPNAGWEVALEDTQLGLHTFEVRATDFEGNVGDPARYTWRLMGIMTIITSGPGFTPPETPFDPPEGGPTLSNDATITFEANVADATFECSLDLEPFEP